MKSTYKCPCIDCLTLPICRHKGFMRIFLDCELAKEYVPYYYSSALRDKGPVREIERVHNPTVWEIKNIPEIKQGDDLIVPKGYTIEKHKRIQDWLENENDKSIEVPM